MLRITWFGELSNSEMRVRGQNRALRSAGFALYTELLRELNTPKSRNILTLNHNMKAPIIEGIFLN